MSARATSAEVGYGPLVAALAALTLVAALVSLMVGYARLDVPAALADAFAGRSTVAAVVLEQIRLPRAALGAMVGFSLGLAGAAMQGLLRNPLADPGVIGVSGGAAFGAVVVFYSGLAGAFALAMPLGGVAGAVVAALLLYALVGRGAGTMTLILAGVTINSLRRRADRAGAQPVAQPLRRLRDHVLADGLARRPQPAAIVAGAAADRRRLGAAAVVARRRSTR